MDFLRTLGLGSAAPVCTTEELCSLLVAVLPTFIAIAEKTRNNLSDAFDSEGNPTGPLRFYIHFNTDVFNLNAVLVKWDPTEVVQSLLTDETELQQHLIGILNELENRFVSFNRAAAPALRQLGFKRKNDETYPKLRGLRRILPEGDTLSEDFLEKVNTIMRIHNKREEKQRRLLSTLGEALKFFYNMQPLSGESDPLCPIRFTDYPLRNMWKLTTKLFGAIQRNWSCQCRGSASHIGRKTRLNLTQHQRFETAPVRGQDPLRRSARFRILFPTSAPHVDWQDTEIAVDGRG